MILVIENGVVVEKLNDVATVGEARQKYPHLQGKQVVPGDHPPGTLWANGVFTPPPHSPPAPEDDVILALRELAGEIGPNAVALINARFGTP